LNNELALADLSVMKSIAPIFRQTKEGEYFGYGQTDSLIRNNDESHFAPEEAAEFNLYMLDIASSIGNFYDCMRNTCSATWNLAASKQFDRAEALIKNTESLPTTDDEQLQIRIVYLTIAKANLFLKEGQREKARALINSIIDHIDSINNDTFLKYEFYTDISAFERECGDTKTAIVSATRAKECGAAMTSSHPEAFSEPTNELAHYYLKLNERDKALAEYKDLLAYSKEIKASGLKARVDGFLVELSKDLNLK
jgi:hypothetical protein